ncbi:glycosyltransferase [Candidatus Pelagibacter sp.]|uniref:glycosyltransferase n=1 Tax=Candidatus Pelagibacter sp. TaxID=2024849 RepID=UPI003F84F2A8
MNIAVLLPFKENFSKHNAGAVSLFVNDINKYSKFKKSITVFGSTQSKEYLSKNYINLLVNDSIFKSSNNSYVKCFLEKANLKKIDILEIHNRPSYIKLIRNSYKNKLFFYFHNDPLSMMGSKQLEERKYLIENTELIFFNSEWSRNRFFHNFKNKSIYLTKTKICYQSTSKTKINFKKKQNIISFIGKLNSAKGYDIFGNSIIKILNKYENWKAIVIGDEPREKMFFHHKNLKILGFKSNKFILNFLKKVNISVVCSRWEEPFGRASLEAASRGSAVIISDKGGLPETLKNGIILKKLNEKLLFKEIEKLIKDFALLRKIQKKNISNFFLTHEFVSKIIDDERSIYEFNKINILKNNKLKILHITNFNQRFNGRLHYNTGKRLNNGFIRLGHNVLTISDRDIINQSKKITDIKGTITLQNSILESAKNFKPDIIILGHADSVSFNTLEKLKNSNIPISQWFLDPITKYGPDYQINKKRILNKNKIIDASFLTTDPNSLDFKLKNSFFMPNPCDISFEILENYNFNNKNDIFFAMSHGVHRGNLKKGKFDDRELFVKKLIKKNENINFDIYGMDGIQPIWSDNFLRNISNSNMALNLSRGKPIKYYSSDRIVQLIGNGLLTFIDEKTQLNDFFSKNEVVFYKNIDDLGEKIQKFKKDDKNRKKIAKQGKKFYFKYFNSTLVADYILKKTLDIKSKNKYLWDQ